MKKNIHYFSTGLVFGNYWGGGRGAYSAKPLEAATKKELLDKANKGLDGSLDAGMGYESLIGALLAVKKVETVVIGGKEFKNEETSFSYVGKLKRSDRAFLLNCYYNQ